MAIAHVTPTARQDFVEILVYLRAKSHRGARRVHAAVNETFQFLADNPGAGQQCEQFGVGMRSFPASRYRDYLIFYRPINGGIEVMRVLHGSRNLARFFR
jgi:toxin ParE1/3/4